MLTYYSLSGHIRAGGRLARATYKIYNLTNGFISAETTSEYGYYNVNLLDYPDRVFNSGDIVSIEFSTRIDGIEYFSRVYTILDAKDSVITINVGMDSNWNYTSAILVNTVSDKADIIFMATRYSTIHYRLYCLYNNKWSLVDTRDLSKQQISLTFNYGGEFKIVGYVMDVNNILLSYSEKTFSIVLKSNSTKRRYIEWE